ncbi:MAG: hypothetical protein HDR95_05135 [Bacteroides sp.]|nr:hypothetical protein [Bacteroides sp.]
MKSIQDGSGLLCRSVNLPILSKRGNLRDSLLLCSFVAAVGVTPFLIGYSIASLSRIFQSNTQFIENIAIYQSSIYDIPEFFRNFAIKSERADKRPKYVRNISYITYKRNFRVVAQRFGRLSALPGSSYF